MANFYTVVEKVIEDLNDGKYKDDKSLRSIIKDFEKMPKSVQFDHVRDIETITNMIDKCEGELLYGQITSLLSLLRSFERPVRFVDYQPKEIKSSKATDTSEILKNFSKERKVEISTVKNIERKVGISTVKNTERKVGISTVKNIEMDVCISKLEQNDVALETLQQLLFNLTRNILLSDITNYLEKYFEILDGLMLENELKYRTFYNDIVVALEMEGYHRAHGFQRQPDQNNIVERLSSIQNFYCS